MLGSFVNVGLIGIANSLNENGQWTNTLNENGQRTKSIEYREAKVLKNLDLETKFASVSRCLKSRLERTRVSDADNCTFLPFLSLLTLYL